MLYNLFHKEQHIMQPVDRSQTYYKYNREGWQILESKVISESAVSLTVNGDVWLSFMCTPTDLEALAVGFLFNERLIASKNEIASVRVCDRGDNVDVWLNHSLSKPTQWQRTSGCNGGFTSVGDPSPRTLPSVFPLISPDVLLDCMDQLLQAQEIYREARGIHCSALSNGDHVIYQAEDIGRHNTLDKLAGFLLFNPVTIYPRIILTTGRISSEMLTKSARLSADVVLSRTSPTTRSIELAEDLGITLIGYARRSQMQVYTHPERLLPPGESRSLQKSSVDELAR
jgi:FdhD protein